MAARKSAATSTSWSNVLTKLRWNIQTSQFEKEAIFLFIAGMSVFYYLANFDFNPRDPSPYSKSFPPVAIENMCGWLGATISGFTHFCFGIGAFLVPIPFLLMGYLLYRQRPFAFSRSRVFGFTTLFVVSLVFVTYTVPFFTIFGFELPTGGALGAVVADFLRKIFGPIGAYVVLATISLMALNLISRRPWIADLSSAILHFDWAKVKAVWQREVPVSKKGEEVLKPQRLQTAVEQAPAIQAPVMPFIKNPVNEELFEAPPAMEEFEEVNEDRSSELPNEPAQTYHPPSTTIFRTSPALGPLKEEQKREYEQTAEALTQAFADFSISGSVVAIQPGPVVTVYEYRPDAGIKISKIMGLIDDIALALKVDSVLMNPVAGKSAIGVQVPNKNREVVYLGDVVNSQEFKINESPMTLGLGKSLSGEPVCADLTTMPHLLTAGATGSGKSVAINTLLCSIILKSSPEQVRMVLVDPKMLELSVYEGIPHLLLPVITDAKKASSALRWACYEMERRYKLMQLAKVRHIRGYNQWWDKASDEEKNHIRREMNDDSIEKLPFLLLVIDELADLMLTAPKDVESSIQRLAQKARASGIHLVLATQRPSVDIITGVIKANLPCRISFQTVSKHDSRTILDQVGSEKLLGKGDMLFLRPGTSRLERIQGAFIEDDEVNSLVDSVKATSRMNYDEEVIDWIDKEYERNYEEGSVLGESECDDPKFDMAVDIAARQGYVSASFLQRQMKIGYNRAARMVEAMEAQGMVGPADGSKPRKWLGPQNEEH